MAKKKANTHDSCIGPKKATYSVKKPQTKADIAEELKAMKKNKKSKKNLGLIALLEKKIDAVEKRKVASNSVIKKVRGAIE